MTVIIAGLCDLCYLGTWVFALYPIWYAHMIADALVCFRYSIWIVSTHFASPQMSFRWAVSSWMVCHGCPICYMICLGKYIRGYGMLFHPWTCNTKHTHLGRSLSIMEQSRGLGEFRAYSYPCSAGFLLWQWRIRRIWINSSGTNTLNAIVCILFGMNQISHIPSRVNNCM